MNKVEITGKICNKKEIKTKNGNYITSFGLNFYNGKKDDKPSYDFINCKYLGRVDVENKAIVDVSGWISVERWDGGSSVVIVCKDIKLAGSKAVQKESVDFPFGDEVPF